MCIRDRYGVEEYARAVAAHGCTANYGQLVGHGTLRGAVMGLSLIHI